MQQVYNKLEKSFVGRIIPQLVNPPKTQPFRGKTW